MRFKTATAAPPVPGRHAELVTIANVRRDWWIRTEEWIERQILLRRSLIQRGASTAGTRMLMRAEIIEIEKVLTRKRSGEKKKWTPHGAKKGGNRWAG